MAKRVTADNWYRMVPDDDTGSLLCIEFTCPYCGEENSEQIFFHETGLTAFETDITCDSCDEDVTVQCY